MILRHSKTPHIAGLLQQAFDSLSSPLDDKILGELGQIYNEALKPSDQVLGKDLTTHACVGIRIQFLKGYLGMEPEPLRQEKDTQIRLHEATLLQACRAFNTAGDQR